MRSIKFIEFSFHTKRMHNFNQFLCDWNLFPWMKLTIRKHYTPHSRFSFVFDRTRLCARVFLMKRNYTRSINPEDDICVTYTQRSFAIRINLVAGHEGSRRGNGAAEIFNIRFASAVIRFNPNKYRCANQTDVQCSSDLLAYACT
jgi:hypothetical protein